VGSAARGWIIAAFIAAYGWFFRQPAASLEIMFLVGALLQITVIAIRRFVPSSHQAEAMRVFELLADGASVFSFAIGVFGGIAALTSQL
jgi:hypothetical protein